MTGASSYGDHADTECVGSGEERMGRHRVQQGNDFARIPRDRSLSLVARGTIQPLGDDSLDGGHGVIFHV